MAKAYRYVARVRVSFTFPLDMLRYDACWPHTGDDAAKIERLVGYGRGADRPAADDTEARTIAVAAYTFSKASPFTAARWASFGCEIEIVEAAFPIG